MGKKEQEDPLIIKLKGQEKYWFHHPIVVLNMMLTTTNLDLQITFSFLRNCIVADPYLNAEKNPKHQLFGDNKSIRKFKSKKELQRLI